MRHRILPLLILTAGWGAALASARGAVVASPSENVFRAEAGLRFSPEVEEEARTLRQSLFKKPTMRIFEPRSRPPSAGAARPAPPPPRALVIQPPPRPREVSLAMRELSLQPATYTPYDRFSDPVRTVIARVDRQSVSMARARALMVEANAFRYRSGDPYRAALPEKTAALRAGDCKAKSLWLYDQLGDGSAFYVIGKTVRGAKSNHAWLYWRCDSRWWILDPTNRSAPIAADSLPKDRYVPYYSFGKEGAYRHRATWIFMAGNSPVAPAVSTPSGKTRVARQ